MDPAAPIPGFEAPVHRALTEPVLLAGAPRTFAIVNGIVLTIAGRHEREIIGRLEKLSELFNDFD